MIYITTDTLYLLNINVKVSSRLKMGERHKWQIQRRKPANERRACEKVWLPKRSKNTNPKERVSLFLKLEIYFLNDQKIPHSTLGKCVKILVAGSIANWYNLSEVQLDNAYRKPWWQRFMQGYNWTETCTNALITMGCWGWKSCRRMDDIALKNRCPLCTKWKKDSEQNIS